MEQRTQDVLTIHELNGLLNEWLCVDCPARNVLLDGIRQGLDSESPLLQNTGKFALRYLKASTCEADELPATCGNLAVQGALGFMLEAQAIKQGDGASQSM